MALRQIFLLAAAGTLMVLVQDASANCKMHDAKWKRNTAPTVTQPSRTDPTRLMVNWANAIENAR